MSSSILLLYPISFGPSSSDGRWTSVALHRQKLRNGFEFALEIRPLLKEVSHNNLAQSNWSLKYLWFNNISVFDWCSIVAHGGKILFNFIKTYRFYLFNFVFGSIFYLIVLVCFFTHIIILFLFQKNSNQKEISLVREKIWPIIVISEPTTVKWQKWHSWAMKLF